jgi:hypothetical protein
MSEPVVRWVAYTRPSLPRGLYPEQDRLLPYNAWLYVYRFVSANKAPDRAFDRDLARMGLTRSEALQLYRAVRFDPAHIDFIAEHVPPPPPPGEEIIGDEGITGYTIYFNFETEKYPVKDENGNLIRTENKICIELTYSISTSTGHDVPVVVEITCTTYVKEKSRTDILQAQRDIDEALTHWLILNDWANLLEGFEKKGVTYNGENAIIERGWYTWPIPDYPRVHVTVEKKKPRSRTYTGEFKAE